MSNELLTRLSQLGDLGRLPEGIEQSDMHLIRLLADAANKATDSCTLKQKKIVARTLLSPSTIRRSLRKWETIGWVTVHYAFRADGGKAPSTYTLNIPRLEESSGIAIAAPGAPPRTKVGGSRHEPDDPSRTASDQEPYYQPLEEPGAAATSGDGAENEPASVQDLALEAALKGQLQAHLRPETYLTYIEPALLRERDRRWFWVTRTETAAKWMRRELLQVLRTAFRELVHSAEPLTVLSRADFDRG